MKQILCIKLVKYRDKYSINVCEKKIPPLPDITEIQQTVQLLTSGHQRMDGGGLHISGLLVPRKERPKGKYKSVCERLVSWVERRERFVTTDMVAELEFWAGVGTGGSMVT